MTQVEEIASLVEGYRHWLKDRTVIKSVHRDWVEITTPFLDRHNDQLQIYAKSDGDRIELTDDGNTIRDLELSGCSLDTIKRRAILQTTVNGFGVTLDGSVIKTVASPTNFSFRKHAILQAIISINDMFHLATSNVRSLFKEDVENWMLSNDIRYVPNIQLAGKSGYQHNFDFAIPRSRRASERIIRAITNPNRDSALSFIAAWTETSLQRAEDAKAIAILNDDERAIADTVLEALEQYDITTIPWSKKNENRDLLAA
jgi:Domain of unknown function DUF1829/Domain of unknown function DUF1828